MKKNKIIILYVFLFVLYPLFMTNGYKNTVMTKCISFALITGVAFFVTAWMDYEKYVTENGGLGNFSIKKSIKIYLSRTSSGLRLYLQPCFRLRLQNIER